MLKPVAIQPDAGQQRDDSGPDPAIAWERDEQERLPPRGAGSQHNQGEEKEPIVAEVKAFAEEDAAEAPGDGLQLGGTRGAVGAATPEG